MTETIGNDRQALTSNSLHQKVVTVLQLQELETIYQIVCQAADTDRDGLVSVEEFDKMMDVATAAQIRLGLHAPFPTREERVECFKVNRSALSSLCPLKV